MPINQKKKGNRGELDLVHILNKKFGSGKFKRCPSSGALVGKSNRELNENLDYENKVVLVADIITPQNFRYVIEHKFYNKIEFWEMFNERSNLNIWFEQVIEDSKFVQKEPMLICKFNYHDRIVFIRQEFPFYVFKYKNFYCYNLKELLEQEENFFYD